MSNCFSCNFRGTGDVLFNNTPLFEPYLTQNYCQARGYHFFVCARTLVTSAAIKDVTINSRFYCVKRLKLDYTCVLRSGVGDTSRYYMMVFVLNVPMVYNVNKPTIFRLSDLPKYTVPENVVYYDLVSFDQSTTPNRVYRSKNIHFDIIKTFNVLPSYKLSFYAYVFGGDSYDFVISEGSVEVFFDVN